MTAKIQYVVEQIEYERIVAGNNDRKKFKEKELRELADSIDSEGLLQPLSLRPLWELPCGHKQIVSGEKELELWKSFCLHQSKSSRIQRDCLMAKEASIGRSKEKGASAHLSRNPKATMVKTCADGCNLFGSVEQLIGRESNLERSHTGCGNGVSLPGENSNSFWKLSCRICESSVTLPSMAYFGPDKEKAAARNGQSKKTDTSGEIGKKKASKKWGESSEDRREQSVISGKNLDCRINEDSKSADGQRQKIHISEKNGSRKRSSQSPKSLGELGEEPGREENGLACPIKGLTAWAEVIAGERRFRAIGLLGWRKVPAIVTSMDDERASVAMLAENVHRVDLDPIEEAKAYAGRIERFGWSVEDCANKAKVSSHRVTNRLSLLKLRDDLQHLVSNGHLKNGYAQIMAASDLDENFQLLAARALRENPAPNTQWFARACGELAEQQNRAYLFDDMNLFGGELKPMFDLEPVEKVRPALPLEVEAPVNGSSPEEIIENQIAFWSEAAEQWDILCHAYYWRECESAVKALEMALDAVKKAPQKEKLF